MGNNGGDIVDGEVLGGGLAIRTAQGIAEQAAGHMAAIDARAQIVTRSIKLGLRQTAPHHWVDYGNDRDGQPLDPRPEDEAAVAIAAVLGASYRWLPMGEGGRFWVQDALPDKPDDYEIMVSIELGAFGRTVQEVGSCRSDDKFFASGARAQGRGVKLTDVLKKAMANALVRALLAIGLRGVTWEMLAEAGIPREKVHRIHFAQSEQAATKGAEQRAATSTCPDCGKDLVIRKGAKGRFLGCSGYPQCRHTEPVPEPGAGEPAKAPATKPTAAGSADPKAPGTPPTAPTGPASDQEIVRLLALRQALIDLGCEVPDLPTDAAVSRTVFNARMIAYNAKLETLAEAEQADANARYADYCRQDNVEP